jgi:putative aminopeptidase FrvX
MEKAPREFFQQLLETPSPSGYEVPAQDVVRKYVGSFADEVRTDVHGNVIIGRNPKAPVRVMLAGHCDQIGLIVQHIDDDGFIYVRAIGGWDIQMLIGQRLTVLTRSGPVSGVIARKAIHLLTDEERKKVPKMKELWLDIGAANKDEARKLVRVGDAVTLELTVREMLGGRIVAPGMDDKTGAWVVVEALRRADPAKMKCALFAVSTVQEEVGLRGARTSSFGVDPHVGVAVDVTHATDCPTVEKKEEGDVALGKGPVIYRGPNMNPRVFDMLVDTAEDAKIPYQLAAEGRATGTDANAMQVNRAGVATGLVSIPNRYMHSPVEMVSLDDMDRAADLLARFVERVGDESEFIPA